MLDVCREYLWSDTVHGGTYHLNYSWVSPRSKPAVSSSHMGSQKNLCPEAVRAGSKLTPEQGAAAQLCPSKLGNILNEKYTPVLLLLCTELFLASLLMRTLLGVADSAHQSTGLCLFQPKKGNAPRECTKALGKTQGYQSRLYLLTDTVPTLSLCTLIF